MSKNSNGGKTKNSSPEKQLKDQTRSFFNVAKEMAAENEGKIPFDRFQDEFVYANLDVKEYGLLAGCFEAEGIREFSNGKSVRDYFNDLIQDAKEAERLEREAEEDDDDFQTTHVETDSIRAYKQSIRDLKRITPERELELAREIEECTEAGDEVGRQLAMDELVNANLRLVMSIATRFQNQGLDYMDLIQFGNMGLIRAAERFDYRRQIRFSTYATYWIKQSIRRGIEDTGSAIRKPVHMNEKMNKYRLEKLALEQEIGREPTVSEVADKMGIDPSEALMYEMNMQKLISTDTPVGDDGDAAVGDFIEDQGTVSPEGNMENEDLKRMLAQCLSKLTDRERMIIERRYGLTPNGETSTLEELGQELNLTRERIRQIESRALHKIRRISYREGLYDYRV